MVRAGTPTILVVDDTPTCRRPIELLLTLEGYRPIGTGNGAEALQSLELVRPALILLDLDMPIMDGIAFLEHLHDDPQWSAVPVIVISGESSGGLVDTAKELGAKDVLVKAHFNPDELLDSIRRYLLN